MFAGKKIHPFFSSWKASKNNREATDTDDDGFQVGRKDRGLTCGPIHVFERTLVTIFEIEIYRLIISIFCLLHSTALEY